MSNFQDLPKNSMLRLMLFKMLHATTQLQARSCVHTRLLECQACLVPS